MVVFWPHLIEPLLEAVAPTVIVEVGIHMGATTEKLLEFGSRHDCVVHSIDPRPHERFDPERLRREHGDRLVVHRERSLEALPRIPRADAALIDGDHNWYTVYNELGALGRSAAASGSDFPLTFLHDVGWPYGRRDLYYDPESVPSAYRQPFERAGLVFGERELAVGGGICRGQRHAVTEGTPRNGVRTAVEDFLAGDGRDLRFLVIGGFQGLGVLASERRLSSNAGLRGLFGKLDCPALLQQCEMLEAARLRTQIQSREIMQELAQARRTAERPGTAADLDRGDGPRA